MERQGVDIGETTLEAVVDGRGPITVVFENGLATSLEAWAAVAPRIAERATTLRYDRRRAAPTGALATRTAGDMVSDLEKLLSALALHPPYVLVGHSWGGIVARVFAHAHPTTVAGLVMVDATHEVIDSPALALLPAMYSVMHLVTRIPAGRRWLFGQLCPATSPRAYRDRLEQTLGDRTRWTAALRTARAEGAGIRASLDQVRRTCPDLPPTPIHVLTAGGVSGANAKSVRRVHDAWQEAVARAPLARYTNVPASGHQLPLEAPEPIIAAIVDVLDASGNAAAAR